MADTTTTNGWTLEAAVAQIEVLGEKVEEAYQDMQQIVAEDRGWARLGGAAATALTRDELNKAAEQCRVMAALNPLVKRGGIIRAGYVWGQGLGVSAKDEAINEIVQEFVDDVENRGILTGHQAHLDLESRLYTDGNVFVSLWTEPVAGKVRPRIIEFTEVVDIIRDPNDSTRAMYYKRRHKVSAFDPLSGSTSTREVVTYYPDIRYRPRTRPQRVGGQDAGDIRWDAPIIHVHDNAPTGTQWGLGDAYAAIPWAKGYSGFLNDWARLTKALSKIAWALSSPTKSKAQQGRAGLAKLGEDGPAGGSVNLADMKLEAVPKTGATIDSESGRPLAAMTAAAIGVPVTTLLADPGQTGARAVAETLDTPTENEMMGRRELWTEFNRSLLNYVIDKAATAPGNTAIRGRVVQVGDQQIVELAGDPDRTLVFDWPDLTGDDPATVIEAALKALDSEKFQGPAEVRLVELVLRAFRVRDVDELMDKIKDADGNLIPPPTTAGDVAVQAFRQGQDPTEAL